MRVGLVLGAGGVIGASWIIGALEALQSETGWDPSEAETIIGTSAGAVVGALAAEGIAPEYMAAYTAGEALDDVADIEERAGALVDQVDGTTYRPALGLPPIGPGSWRLALNTLTRPRSHSPAAMLSGWLPRGFISTDPITRLVESFVAGDWPAHPAFWAVAADYTTGKRVAFGSDGAPPARIGEAVAASCAIPGFYRPPSINGRRYVDGGICSLSNLDLLCDAGLDLVVCLNPTSSLAHVASPSPSERLGAIMRAVSGRRVGSEARKLRDCGTEVLLLQPGAADLGVMGVNFMARSRRLQVTEQAVRSTAMTLRELRGTGAVLPGPQGRRTRSRSASAGAPRAA